MSPRELRENIAPAAVSEEKHDSLCSVSAIQMNPSKSGILMVSVETACQSRQVFGKPCSMPMRIDSPTIGSSEPAEPDEPRRSLGSSLRNYAKILVQTWRIARTWNQSVTTPQSDRDKSEKPPEAQVAEVDVSVWARLPPRGHQRQIDAAVGCALEQSVMRLKHELSIPVLVSHIILKWSVSEGTLNLERRVTGRAV